MAFISNIMDSDVEFVAVDFPQVNRLTVHILAAVAEHEREMISQRTKAALAAAKARGTVLGTDNLTDAARRLGTAKSAEVRRRKAQERAADFMQIIETIRVGGVKIRFECCWSCVVLLFYSTETAMLSVL